MLWQGREEKLPSQKLGGGDWTVSVITLDPTICNALLEVGKERVSAPIESARSKSEYWNKCMGKELLVVFWMEIVSVRSEEPDPFVPPCNKKPTVTVNDGVA